MATWIPHAPCMPDLTVPGRPTNYDVAWKKAFDEMTNWPRWSGDPPQTNPLPEFSDRYEGTPGDANSNSLRLLGYGAYGLVFAATRKRTHQRVAVKMFYLVDREQDTAQEMRALLFMNEIAESLGCPEKRILGMGRSPRRAPGASLPRSQTPTIRCLSRRRASGLVPANW